MKRVLISVMLSMLPLVFISCGGNKGDDTVLKEGKTVQSVQKKQNMTLAKACKLNNELATLLMQNYWGQFKGKEYQDIKDIYKKYLREKDAIYNKYGVSTNRHGFNVQSYIYWVRDNRIAMKKFRKENPEYDFYVKYPEFSDASIQLYKYSTAEYSESKKNQF